MKYAVALAVAAFAVGLAGSAAAADACFRTNDMRNHTIVDDHTLYVAVGGKEVWRLEMKGSCLAGVTSSDPLVIKTTASTGMVCKALDLDLSVKRGGAHGIASPCIVDKVAKLTPEETAAIPKNLKP